MWDFPVHQERLNRKRDNIEYLRIIDIELLKLLLIIIVNPQALPASSMPRHKSPAPLQCLFRFHHSEPLYLSLPQLLDFSTLLPFEVKKATT